jgi:hypothetical protein
MLTSQCMFFFTSMNYFWWCECSYSSIGAAKCLDWRDQECMLIDCNPLAQARCDDTNNPVQLATLVSECQEYLLSLSLQLLSTPDSIKPAIFQDLVHQNDEDSYANLQPWLKQLRGTMRLLSSLPDIGLWCSDGTTTVIFCNLYRLHQRITEMNLEVESTLFHVLDAHPEKMASSLKLVMKQVSIYHLFPYSLSLSSFLLLYNIFNLF